MFKVRIDLVRLINDAHKSILAWLSKIDLTKSTFQGILFVGMFNHKHLVSEFELEFDFLELDLIITDATNLILIKSEVFRLK